MPHISVRLFPGRSRETKENFARAVCELAARMLSCEEEHVSVAVEDCKPCDWLELYEREIERNENIIILPQYERAELEEFKRSGK